MIPKASTIKPGGKSMLKALCLTAVVLSAAFAGTGTAGASVAPADYGKLTPLADPLGCYDVDGTTGFGTTGIPVGGQTCTAAQLGARRGSNMTSDVSPDGKNVYTIFDLNGGTGISVMTRNTTTGALSHTSGNCLSTYTTDGPLASCKSFAHLPEAGFYGAAIKVSPDGKQVYALGVKNDGWLVVFDRNQSTGALTQKSAGKGCFVEDGKNAAPMDGCSIAFGLDDVYPEPDNTALQFSPDDKYLYVQAANGVIVFNRNTSNGELTVPLGTKKCISGTNTTRWKDNCTTGDGISGSGVNSMAISPDGKYVYITSAKYRSFAGIVALARSASDGSLSRASGKGYCLMGGSDDSNGSCTLDTVLSRITPNEPYGLSISPDGKNLYWGEGNGSSPRFFYHFLVNSSGEMSTPVVPDLCFGDSTHSGDCTYTGNGDGYQTKVTAVSPDGKNLYVGSAAGGLSVWDLDSDGAPTNKQRLVAADGPCSETNCVNTAIMSGADSIAFSPDGLSAYVNPYYYGTYLLAFKRNADPVSSGGGGGGGVTPPSVTFKSLGSGNTITATTGGSAKLSFTASSGGLYTLTIAKDRKVYKTLKGSVYKGSNKLTLSAAGLSPGVYIVMLTLTPSVARKGGHSALVVTKTYKLRLKVSSRPKTHFTG